MSIRSRIYFLIFLFGFVLLINFGALGFLVLTASRVLNTADIVLQQQSAAVRMQAQLRDAEAALYRYEIEGETGFATHFKDQLNLFEDEIRNYEQLVTTSEEETWVSDLQIAHQNALDFGENLIEQRDLQNVTLRSVETIQADVETLLTGPMQDIKADDLVYQDLIGGMSITGRDILIALISYLDSPREINRVQFVDGVAKYRSHLNQFEEQVSTQQEQVWASELNQSIDDVELLGSQLISGRIQQKADYANFALLLFRAAQGTIVDEIQSQASENIAQAQADLSRAVRNSLMISLVTGILTLVIFLSVTFPLLQRMNRNILSLLRGADSVAGGDFTTSVEVSDQFEFNRLASAFNEMIGELATRENRLRMLIQKLALVQEEERRLVGLDLHDGLTQMLLSANMHFNVFASKYQNGGAATAPEQLERGRNRLQEAINEARWVVSELRPTELEDYGLIDGINHYVTKVAQSSGWQADVRLDLDEEQLSPEAEVVIFRIVQEALSNARKYADTQRILVELYAEANHIQLRIKDWGRGFNLSVLNGWDERNDHLGVIGMEERAELIYGEFDIQSAKGEGTQIEVKIPFDTDLGMLS
ncbi:MAG: sensor histidine kinase [Chloroflexota bacterium]